MKQTQRERSENRLADAEPLHLHALPLIAVATDTKTANQQPGHLA